MLMMTGNKAWTWSGHPTRRTAYRWTTKIKKWDSIIDGVQADRGTGGEV